MRTTSIGETSIPSPIEVWKRQRGDEYENPGGIDNWSNYGLDFIFGSMGQGGRAKEIQDLCKGEAGCSGALTNCSQEPYASVMASCTARYASYDTALIDAEIGMLKEVSGKGMDTTVIIGIVALAVLILGAGTYFLFKK